MPYQASLGVIALTRFGYGPRGSADVAEAARDAQGFLRAQFDDASLPDRDLPSTKEALQQLFSENAARRAKRVALALEPVTAGTHTTGVMAPSNEQEIGAPKPPRVAQTVFRSEALARLRRAVETPAGFVERLVAFWSNHFCISAAKGGVARITAGAYEREAIRPHVLGRFADMLLAVERHPAMLHYLDNARSIGPGSRAGQRSGRGLNENLGREILELHTLGVGGGYGQVDVTDLARILTGWTFVGPPGKLGEPGTFAFNADAHEPGPVALLGRSYDENGPEQGRDALLALARHPATAVHLAIKLARAFVADEPAPALIERLARTFRDTAGDLRAVALALIDAPESWVPEARRVRDPYEFLVGTHRLLQHRVDDPAVILGPLRTMGMPLWQPPGPNGYASGAAVWAAPEAMKLRLDYAAAAAKHLPDVPDPRALLDALCGGTSSGPTRDAVGRAESRAQGLALLLMSPEMQRI